VSVNEAIAARWGIGPAFSRWLRLREAPALIFLAVLVVFFSVTTGRFLTPDNIESVLGQIAVLGIIALAVNQVVLAGEIDISVGSMLGLCALGAGLVATSAGGVVLPLLAAVAIGVAVGTFNGLLVTLGRVPAIIVTLGMLYALRGVILIWSGGKWVTGVPEESRILGSGSVLGVGAPVLVLFALFALLAFVARQTAWGRDVLAVGGNRRAARLVGLPIDRTRFLTFVLVGLFVGIAAMVYLGRAGTVQSNTGQGLELQVIAAIVVGGTSIAGGRGSSLAAMTGAVLIGVILNGMVLLGVPGIWQDVVLGGLILAAITTDAFHRRLLGAKA
jgi:ribose/xylose/arabinose/galactoside ABC-type transport system permease subunit